MDRFFNIINDILNQLPVYQKLFFGTIFFGLFSFVWIYSKNAQFRAVITNFVKRTLSIASAGNLFTHRLFYESTLLQNKIKNVSFGSEYLDFLFTTLLECKIKSVVTNAENFLKDFGWKKADKEYLFVHLIRLMNCMINEYNHNFINIVCLRYGSDKGRKIALWVIDEFSRIHQRNIDLLVESMEFVKESNILNSNQKRLEYIFFETYRALRAGLMDVERTFKNANGQLKKLVEN